MSRALSDLNPIFRPLVFEFLARLTEAVIHVVIVDTLRTAAEHEANLKAGKSWTTHSLHLDGAAIDVCPLAEWELRGHNKLQWDADDQVWETIGAIGEKVGLKWGVWLKRPATVPAWRRRGEFVNVDLGHFQMPAGPKIPGGLDA